MFRYMKALVSFFTDSIYVVLFFLLATAAFLSTYALTPVPFKDSILSQDNQPMGVLGDQAYSGVRYKQVYRENEFFKIGDLNQRDKYIARIEIGPLSDGEARQEVLELINDSNIDTEATVSLKASKDEVSGINAGVYTSNEKISLSDGRLERKVYIPAESSINLDLFVKSDFDLNFPLEFTLEVN